MVDVEIKTTKTEIKELNNMAHFTHRKKSTYRYIICLQNSIYFGICKTPMSTMIKSKARIQQLQADLSKVGMDVGDRLAQ